MQQVIHSAFLQSLGYAIINSLWQFALLWLIYVSVNTVGKLSSYQKYTAGLVLQIAGFTWFIVTLSYYYNPVLQGDQAIFDQSYIVNTEAANAATGKEKFLLWFLETERFLPYLSIAYLALLVFLSLRWIFAYKKIQIVRTTGLQKIDVNWRLFVQQLSYQLGIKRNVKIYLSHLVQSPMTIGFFKPLILIPLASINHLSAEQMEAVILHELAHIKRFDYLFNLFLALIEICLFFNPFMQLIKVHIKRERENCCDDWVLQYNYNATSYARALLLIASNNTPSLSLALHAANDKHMLLNRIKRIIEKKERTFFNYKHQLMALFVMTTVFSSLSLLSPKKEQTQASDNARVVPEPMVATIDNPLFNPVFFLANAQKIRIEEKLKVTDTVSEKLAAIEKSVTVPQIQLSKADVKDVKTKTEEQKPDLPIFDIELPILSEDKFVYDFKKEFERNAEVAANNRIRSERNERESRKLEKRSEKFRIAAPVHPQVRFQFDQDKFAKEMEKVVAQLKAARKDVELAKLKSVLITGLRRIQEGKSNDKLSVLTAEQLDEMAKEIEEQIKELEQQNFLSALNTGVNFNFTIPSAVYELSGPDPHSYSFEFRENPRMIPAPPAPAAPDDCVKSPKKSKEDIDEKPVKALPGRTEVIVNPLIKSQSRVFIIKI